MGAGNKMDPTRFKVSDINKTSVCPLARVIRRELKKIGVKKLKWVYSDEISVGEKIESEERRKSSPSSISFIPSAIWLFVTPVPGLPVRQMKSKPRRSAASRVSTEQVRPLGRTLRASTIMASASTGSKLAPIGRPDRALRRRMGSSAP